MKRRIARKIVNLVSTGDHYRWKESAIDRALTRLGLNGMPCRMSKREMLMGMGISLDGIEAVLDEFNLQNCTAVTAFDEHDGQIDRERTERLGREALAFIDEFVFGVKPEGSNGEA